MLDAMDEHADHTVTTLDELLSLMAPRSSRDDLSLIERAYNVAHAAHINQKRSSGEPYIQHPLAVAGILAQTKLDTPTIAAALMHDVVEDTPVKLDDIRAQFGNEIASLVDAVTKLSKREGIKQEFAAPVATNGKTAPQEPMQPQKSNPTRHLITAPTAMPKACAK